MEQDRELITKKQIIEALDKSVSRIDFGTTSMGIVEAKGIGSMAIGLRRIPKTKPEIFHILELLGPLSLEKACDIGDASFWLETLLEKVEAMGITDRVDAIVVDSSVFFGLYAERLVVDDLLIARPDGYAQGLAFLNSQEYKILASSSSGVLGLGNNAVLVDKDLNPVP